MQYQAPQKELTSFLSSLLEKRAEQKGLDWLKLQKEKLQQAESNRSFFLAFSTASRFFSKSPLHLAQPETEAAEQLRKGFNPDSWDLLQTVRVYLLLLVPVAEEEKWLKLVDQLFETADMQEQVALFAALPVLPYPNSLNYRCREGLRTNITSVFDAIALNNPYPADYLDENGWNQMVLKAVFMQRPLYKIYGADDRANPKLADMLLDFAHERWAAGRKVMPELWRFVVPYLNEVNFADIERVLSKGEALEVEAVLLACSRSASADLNRLASKYEQMRKQELSAKLSWKDIGERFAGGSE